MIIADLVRAPLAISIPFFALHWLPGVFFAVFLIAVASAFFNPAKQAILPNLVPVKLLAKANGLISSSEETMQLLGYSAAGLIVAAISWIPLFLIDGVTYLVSAATLLGVPDHARAAAREPMRLVSDIKEGMRFVGGNPTLRSTFALTFFAVFFAGLTIPIVVVMAYGPFHANALGYGLLEAAIGAGSIVGALVAADAMNRIPAGTLILIGVAGWGVAAAFTGLASSLWLAIVFLAVSGAANLLYYVPLISITQHEAPDRVRGRVMSTRFLLVQSALLLGMAFSGPLADRLGAPLVFVGAGILLVVAALVGLAFPSLRYATVRDESTPVTKAAASG
jgi:MFS family permease